MSASTRFERGVLGRESFETARLVLRPQRVEDAAVFHTLWSERDPRVPARRRIGADGHPTVADVTAHLAGASDTRSDLLTVQDARTGAVHGYCGLVYEGDGTADRPEIAFELRRAVHGRGYATEAAQAVLAWAEAAGHGQIWASVWEWNVASRRVLAKLGFVDSGHQLPAGEHGRNILTVRQFPTTPRESGGADV